MELAQLQKLVRSWATHNFPDTLPYRPLLGAVEELGELCHAHLKAEQGIRNTAHEDKADAVADTIIFLADYCNRNGIDIDKAVSTTWEHVSRRDWLKFPGNGIDK